MIKKELVKKTSLKTGIEEKDCSAVIEAAFETITDSAIQGEDVTIRRFGTFEVVTQKAKKGRDIGRGLTIDIPERRTVKLKVSKLLKSRL